MTKILEEWTHPERTGLDFIIVGAGAGGAPLAARLVERGYTVLVVEMGPEKPAPAAGSQVENTEVPLLHTETTEDPRHSSRVFVKHFDHDPDQSLDCKVHLPDGARRDERGIFYPRAQGVGGCTVHHAMITITGLSEDWDEIAEATGDESWRGERMRPYFQRLERCHYARPGLPGRLRRFLGLPTGWENSRHGDRGWLDTTMADLRLVKQDRQFLAVVVSAARGALKAGADRVGEFMRAFLTGRAAPGLDPNHWETMRQSEEGLARIPSAITPGGERSSPRGRLLKLTKPDSVHRSRLHLLTGACVTRILLDGNPDRDLVGGLEARCRARGVACVLREHVYEADPAAQVDDGGEWEKDAVLLFCRREVVLCGGTFNTPQMLLLSGIGPERHLAEIGIEPRVPLPGVGENLQDRYEIPVASVVSHRFESIDGLAFTSASVDPHLKRWIDNKGKPAFRRGPYATNGGLIGIFMRSAQEDIAPDLFIFALPAYFPGYYVGYSKGEALIRPIPGDPPEYRRNLTWLILKARTRNRDGYVRLRDRNPFRRPEINFRSFPDAPDASLEPPAPGAPFPPSKDQDLEALYQGVCFVQGIIDIGKDQGTIQDSFLPGFDQAKFGGNVRKWIKHTSWGHHACGTCRIGAEDDPRAVLDSRFRVRGVKNLRVVDASVFPRIPGFFIVANIYMIAEKAADVLAEDHPLDVDKLPPEVRTALKQDPVWPSSPTFEARRLYPAKLEAEEAELIAKRRQAAKL